MLVVITFHYSVFIYFKAHSNNIVSIKFSETKKEERLVLVNTKQQSMWISRLVKFDIIINIIIK